MKGFYMANKNGKDSFQPIRIVGEGEITIFQNNVSKVDALCSPRISPLCRISFRLSCCPPYEWARMFINAWKNPSSYIANWHRSDMASIEGDKVILNETTEEQVEKYHRKTLDQAIESANHQYQNFLEDRRE
jgi:hypothetical protein